MKKLNSIFLILLLIKVETIFSQDVFFQKYRDLDFGDVFIGYSATVLDTDPTALKISFFHNSPTRENFLITFILPTNLTNGIDNIPINFSGYASWSKVDAITGRTYFNPYSPLQIRKIKANQKIYMWLGGQITSSSSITPGLYTGNIIITIEVL
jgi:hypothetical protein